MNPTDILLAKNSLGGKPHQWIKLPGIGNFTTEKIDESEDSYSFNVASWEVVDGWVFVKARNEAEVVIVGTKPKLLAWAKDVELQLQTRPLADTLYRPWTPEDGGVKQVKDALRVCRGVLRAFGIQEEITVLVSKSNPTQGKAIMDSILLMDIHRPSSTERIDFFDHIKVPMHLAIAAHEAAHRGYKNGGRVVLEAIRAWRKEDPKRAVSLYHTFTNDHEGVMDAAVAYIFAPQRVKELAPTVYDALVEWFGGNTRIRVATGGYRLSLEFDSDDPEFSRGFEAGTIWHVLNKDQPDQVSFKAHRTNLEMVRRMARASGYECEETNLNSEWADVQCSRVIL